MAAVTSAVAVGVGQAVSASRSASKSRKAMKKGTDATLAENARQYDQTREDYAPYREAGTNALNNLSDPTANFEASPDYEFRRSEGLRDIGNQFAARGGGGNAMKALTGYSSNLASNEFGNWFNRNFNVANMGRGAAAGTAQAGMQMAGNNSNAIMGNAMHSANSHVQQGNAVSNAITGGISNVLYERGKTNAMKPKYDFQGRVINYG